MAANQRHLGFLVTHDSRWRWLVLVAPYTWLVIFCAIPITLVLKISLAEPVLAQPPYTPLIDVSQGGALRLSIESYTRLGQDELYGLALANAVRIAGISTLLCLIAGYPMAYAIARATPGYRVCLLVLVAVPFWTAFLIRVYAWMGILSTQGLVNGFLKAIGATEVPLVLLHTELAVYLGIAYVYLPFMILPLYVNLTRIDPMIVDAARDLGGTPTGTFRRVIFPLSLPGVAAGCVLVFVPSMGEFVIPELLGGAETLMIGQVLWDEFFVGRNWPMACAIASLLLVLVALPVAAFQHLMADGVRP